jgi:myosin heavy subunit
MRTLGVVVVAVALGFTGCNNRADQLEQQNQQLVQELAARDQFVEEMTTAINDVFGKLEQAQAMEQEIVRQSEKIEGGAKMTSTQVRKSMMAKLTAIDKNLSENRSKVSELQEALKTSQKQYSGLRGMLSRLQQSLDEREKSIAELQTHLASLQAEVTEKSKLISEQESTIASQQSTIQQQDTQLKTGYYVVGKKGELEDKGIIRKEGGFMWGLLGSTTTLANGFDDGYFRTIDKSRTMTIEVDGTIDEIIPKRKEGTYEKDQGPNNLTVLRILQPESFWQENHLVIVTD